MKVNNKWTADEEAYIFHIQNKDLMRQVVSGDGCKKLKLLKDLIIHDGWYLNENNEGDPPNMDVFRQIWSEYFTWAKQEGIPSFENAFLEKVGKKVLSLIRQDSAYRERIGGVLFYFLYHETEWKSSDKQGRMKIIENARDWWDQEDKRDRTRTWIRNVFNCIIRGYDHREFWENSINKIMDLIFAYKDKIQYTPEYHPSAWFGREKGKLNQAIHAGEA